MEIVKTQSLSKAYKNFFALQNVSITINKGDIYGLIGRNGAGKTTLMRIITGLTQATGGTYSLFGLPAENPDARARIGAIIESPALYNGFTAIQNLQAVAVLRGIDKDSPKITEMLQFVGLSAYGMRRVKNFSLGMRQRLSIAMLLLHDPEFLVLDEPVNGLDPVGIVETRELIKKLNRERGVTVLISSHLLTELSQLATKFAIIERGRLVEEISAADLNAKMSKSIVIMLQDYSQLPAAAQLLKSALNLDSQIINGRLVIGGVAADAPVGAINKTLADAGIYISGLQTESVDLEKYFIQVTGGGQV